jgi:hypothetical protein
MKPVENRKKELRTRMKIFSCTILNEAERLQIRLFEPPQAVSFEFAVERDLEWSKKYY